MYSSALESVHTHRLAMPEREDFKLSTLAATLSLHKEVGQEPAWNLLAAGQCENPSMAEFGGI